MRGDIKTRYDSYYKGRMGGWMSVNDIRKLEDENPVPGGDSRMKPANMIDLEDEDPQDPPTEEPTSGNQDGLDPQDPGQTSNS